MSPTFKERLYLSSVPLIRIGAHGLPTACASGCLIDYRGKHILLTVSHATGDNGNWAIQLLYEPGKGTKLYRLGAMRFLATINHSLDSLRNIDFSYVEVPDSVIAYRQEIEAPSNTIKTEYQISIHTPSLICQPTKDDQFGFCGQVLPSPEEHFGQMYLMGELRIYEQLTYSRTDGDYLVFKLPFKHPGHQHFKGCSGAPILNTAGEPIALVCEGRHENDEIWGISLAAYKCALDILAYEKDV